MSRAPLVAAALCALAGAGYALVHTPNPSPVITLAAVGHPTLAPPALVAPILPQPTIALDAAAAAAAAAAPAAPAFVALASVVPASAASAPVTLAAAMPQPTAPATQAPLASAPDAAPPAASAPAATTAAPTESATDVAVAPAKPTPPPPPPITLVAKVDLTNQRVTVIENGKAKFTWTISSGRQGFPTPVGTFKPQWTAKMWYSRKYEMSPMPHSVFFKDGAAFHATQWTNMLGQPASHGCVRLAPAHAATFYNMVHRHGMAQTRIQVFGAPKQRRTPDDMIASRRDRRPSSSQYVEVYPGTNGSPFMFNQPAPRPIRYKPMSYNRY